VCESRHARSSFCCCFHSTPQAPSIMALRSCLPAGILFLAPTQLRPAPRILCLRERDTLMVCRECISIHIRSSHYEKAYVCNAFNPVCAVWKQPTIGRTSWFHVIGSTMVHRISFSTAILICFVASTSCNVFHYMLINQACILLAMP
jgi:hypothetical protein